MIRLLPRSVPLFVPDIPGYGLSTPVSGSTSASHTKRVIGRAILSALFKHIYSHQSAVTIKPTPILLVGHDRGARVVHHLLIDIATYSDRFTLVGAGLLDIVPTIVQWEAMSRPTAAAGFFHWPFLANVDLAVEMIQAFGGDKFVQRNFDRWRSTATPSCEQRLSLDGAYEVYQKPFLCDSVIRATCLDYAAGAREDIDEEKSALEAGRKIGVPVLLLYSAVGLGKRFDVPASWKNWVYESEKRITEKAVGGGAGHFFAEENPEETVGYLIEWFKGLGVFARLL